MPFMFNITKQQLSPKTLKVWEKVATKHGCEVNGGNIPGTGWQYWFCGPNHGSPHDENLKSRVMSDLHEALNEEN